MFFFSFHACITSAKHVVHSTLKFCQLSELMGSDYQQLVDEIIPLHNKVP